MMQLLEYAVTLEVHRNFARAAKHLGISQPTLTRGIQELERQLGVRLFDRTRQGVFPTAVGKIAIDGARKISGCFEDLKSEIVAFTGLQRSDLYLGVGPLVAQTWFPDASLALLANHPSVEVHVSTQDWWELTPQLLNRTIELAIGEVVPSVHRQNEIEVIPFPARPIRFFCRAGHPLTKIRSPSMGQIGQYAMASFKLPLRCSDHFGGTRSLGKLSANGMCFEPQISCATFDVCLRIIKSSDNIGIAPLALLTRITHESGCVIIPFDAPGLRTNYGIIRLRNRTLSPSAAAFLEQATLSEERYFAIEEVSDRKSSRRKRL
jgi:DNA-binding transcriptional LysR family regulator